MGLLSSDSRTSMGGREGCEESQRLLFLSFARLSVGAVLKVKVYRYWRKGHGQ